MIELPLVPTSKSPFGRNASSRALATFAIDDTEKPRGTARPETGGSGVGVGVPAVPGVAGAPGAGVAPVPPGDGVGLALPAGVALPPGGGVPEDVAGIEPPPALPPPQPASARKTAQPNKAAGHRVYIMRIPYRFSGE